MIGNEEIVIAIKYTQKFFKDTNRNQNSPDKVNSQRNSFADSIKDKKIDKTKIKINRQDSKDGRSIKYQIDNKNLSIYNVYKHLGLEKGDNIDR